MEKSRVLPRELSFDVVPYLSELRSIVFDAQKLVNAGTLWIDHDSLRGILIKYPQGKNHLFRRSHIIAAYRHLEKSGEIAKDDRLVKALQMKPMRTQSGVAPVTVLTKPFPCPGKCIFCPNDVRMPKSYLADEPGAQRAERNHFDPYLQAYNRLLAFQSIGHNVEKVELIILGGTWSFYPEAYQIWFIKRCFDAMNDFGKTDGRAQAQSKNIFETAVHPGGTTNRPSYNDIVSKVAGGRVDGFFQPWEKADWPELEFAQKINETAACRNVGLVIETRPDSLNEKEIIKTRRLGATKVQIGIQSLDDTIMAMNKRGHTQAETRHAIELLRLAGFKIHGHWMPNLYGATVVSDIADYQKLWEPDYSPDELKIYPTSIIANTELNDLFEQGKYKPYTQTELMEVLIQTIPYTPRYARLTRIIRDIPSTDIVEGNKFSNFRQMAESEILKQGKKLEDIRAREVKNLEVTFDDLELETQKYKTSVSTEYFFSYKTKKDDKITSFLRLSLPQPEKIHTHFIPELSDCAMIREVHVYGQVVGLGQKDQGKAQHLGLGTKLIELACLTAKNNGYKKLAVITAIGTREYYRKRGFLDTPEGRYLIKTL